MTACSEAIVKGGVSALPSHGMGGWKEGRTPGPPGAEPIRNRGLFLSIKLDFVHLGPIVWMGHENLYRVMGFKGRSILSMFD
ncbi:hypothetical protein EMIT0P201_12604 [Pseudomonas chlororaphis]